MNDRALTTEKRKLRDAMARKRRELPPHALGQASESVARHFADHPILAFEPSFAGYIAMRSEIDVRPIFGIMARFNKQTALPRMTEQKTLEFHAWKPGEKLVRHAMGVEEPELAAPIIMPALVLVPLLAFDGDGYRLGYGGGYYDRTMEAARKLEKPPLFIGVAYAMQELDQVPTDENDQPLDGILTELGVSMFSA